MNVFRFACMPILLHLLIALPGQSAELAKPEPVGKPATTIYRQILPDGRVMYSDRRIKGAKLDEAITVTSPPPGAAARSASAPQEEPPRISRAPALQTSGGTRTRDNAAADVVRAEILLEDARRRQDVGAEPLPGERRGTASGRSMLTEAYHARQRRLAEDVAIAEGVLRKSVAERDAIPED